MSAGQPSTEAPVKAASNFSGRWTAVGRNWLLEALKWENRQTLNGEKGLFSI